VLGVDPERRFVTEASERLIRLRFDHELDDSQDGQLLITQRVQMTGLATPLMRRTIGPRLERSIPVALANLVELAKGRPADCRVVAAARAGAAAFADVIGISCGTRAAWGLGRGE